MGSIYKSPLNSEESIVNRICSLVILSLFLTNCTGIILYITIFIDFYRVPYYIDWII